MSPWRVPTFAEDVWIALRRDVPRGGRALLYAPGQASFRVEEWFQTASGRGVLLAICQRLGPLVDGALTPAADLRARVRVALLDGDLVAYRQDPLLLGAPSAKLEVVEQKREEPREALTWIEIVFVWADDGSPVPGLKIEVTAPGQAPAAKQTDGSGKVRLDSIKPGSCRVTSSFEGVKAAECVTFVDMGEPPEPPKPPPGGPKPRKRKDDRPAPKAVALLRPYRARATDTLASLAATVGLTWQQLARFNWGVDDPEGVNKHLREDVGCWKKTADGANYLFSDFDDPGVVVLPRPWLVTDLPTTDTHYVQVRRLPPAPRFMAWSQ